MAKSPQDLSPSQMPHRLIRASAGSGKTFKLSRRYLSLLRDGAEPRSILATTFTRKAAGEILERVLTTLADSAASEEAAGRLRKELDDFPVLGDSRLDVERSRALLRELCRHLHQLSISTLDSFFHRIITCFALDLGLPAAMQVLDDNDPQIERLRLEAIEAVLAEAAASDAAFATLMDLLRRLHHDQTRRSVTQAIDDIVSELYDVYREQPNAAAWHGLTAEQPALDESALVDASQALVDLEATTPTTKAGKPRSRFADALSNIIAAVHARQWQRLLEIPLVQRIWAGDAQYDRAEIPDDWQRAIGRVIQHASTRTLEQIAAATSATHELLRRFDEHFASRKRAEGIVTFADLTATLSRRPPALDEVYYRLDGQVRHLLLDEFQDTSLQQWQVLGPLAMETAADATDERSFFCVGDQKQAIYGWRGGCAALFDHVREQLNLPASAEQPLNRSFRSAQPVLDVVNQVFEAPQNLAMFDNEPTIREAVRQWSAGFEQHTAAKRQLAGYVALSNSPAAGDMDEGSPVDNLHELYVAQRIVDLTRRHPGRSIGVLVGTNRYAGLLLDLLHQQNIPASGEGGVAVTDDYFVNLVLAAMRLADHPGDEVVLFQLFHSPMAAVLGLDAITTAQAMRVSRQVREQLLGDGYGATVSQWARQLARQGDRRNALRLTQLAQLAEDYESRRTLRPMDFVRYIERQRIEQMRDAAVRVMTVHKSKGLDFDIVVLPQLLQSSLIGAVQANAVCTLRREQTGPILAVVRSGSEATRALSPILQEAYDQQRERRVQDDLSGLYVAMTRARHAVHMIVPPIERTQRGPSSKGWSNLTYATLLRQALVGDRDQPDYEGPQVLFEHGDPDWDDNRSAAQTSIEVVSQAPVSMPMALALSKSSGRRGWPATSPSQLEHSGRLRGRDLLTVGGETARLRGVVMHALFEHVAWLDDGEGQALEPADWLPHARAAAGQVDEATLTAWVQVFLDKLRQPAIRQALSRPAGVGGPTALHREWPMVWREDGQLFQARADRVVVKQNEQTQPVQATIIDFKTDDVTTDAALAEAVQRYQPQLAAYARAVCRALELPLSAVQARLLFTVPGQVLPVSLE